MAGRASILGIGIASVQVLGVLLLAGLEILSGYRAGVMQHLYYNKIHYLNSLYGSDMLVVHLVGLVICTACLMVLLPRTGVPVGMWSRGWSAMFCLAPAAAFVVPWFGGLNIYAYLLIWLETCLVLEMARVSWCGAGC